MAVEWISARMLAKMLEIPDRTIRRIIQTGHYQNHRLITRKIKAQRGKPAYQILWDTDTHQPARGEPHDAQPAQTEPSLERLTKSPTTLYQQPDQMATNNPATSGPATLSITPTMAVATATATLCQRHDTHDRRKTPHTHPQAQTTALPVAPEHQILSITLDDLGSAVDMDVNTGELIMSREHEQERFETLLHRKTLGKNGNTKRSMKAYYRKQYQATGKIPDALLPINQGDSKAAHRLRGLKSTLDEKIINRFIERVKNSANRDSNEFITVKQRKIAVYKWLLEKEFTTKIGEHQLRALVKRHQLTSYLKHKDEDTKEKRPEAWSAEPVGALVMMDGVNSHYFKILHDGKYKKVTYIEFFDMGSRKLLAMHAYLSESSANSIDIFKRFLRGNTFVKAPMALRPDNAGGFVNLKRPMHELNTGSQWTKGYSNPGGFIFIDDYARAGEPQDKAHLESSHRSFHAYEMVIIDHFKDRIAGVDRAMTKVGNEMEEKDVYKLAISLDELNASGLTEQYMAQHNDFEHRFSENGLQKKWIPGERWNDYLSANTGNTFSFAEADINACTRYGYDKDPATISKKGTITHQGKSYYVDDRTLWSRQSSTDVTVSLIDGELALFTRERDGRYLGQASLIKIAQKSAKVIAKTQAKIAKIDGESVAVRIAERLRAPDYGMIVDDAKLAPLVKDGLTVDVVDQLLTAESGKYKLAPGTEIGFLLFLSAAKKWLHQHKPETLIPYAGKN